MSLFRNMYSFMMHIPVLRLQPLLAAGFMLFFSVYAGTTSAQPRGTILVANMSDNTVSILDATDGTTHATLPSGPAPHEIAVSESGRWAVVSNYGDRNTIGSSLTVIDVPAASIEQTIHLDLYQRPHGIAFLPGDTLVAVTSEVTGNVVVVDIRQGDVVRTIPTGQRASHMLGASRDGRTLYTTNVVDSTVSHIDPIEGVRRAIYPVAAYVEGVNVSPDGSQVWVGSNVEKTVTVLDAATGRVLGRFDGFGFPYRMVLTPDGSTALLADPGRSEVRFVDARLLTLKKTLLIPTSDASVPSAEFSNSAAPEGITVSRDGRFAFVSLQALNRVAVLDVGAMEVAATYETGAWPDGIGYSPVAVE